MTSVDTQAYHAVMHGDGANLATGIDEVLAVLRAARESEFDIDCMLGSAMTDGSCLVLRGNRLFYNGRDFWIEPVDWGGADPYEVDGPVDNWDDWTNILTRASRGLPPGR